MALYRNSRYADNRSRDIMLVRDGHQTRTVTRTPPSRKTPTGGFHIWRAGDRLDQVAQWVLGDPKLGWRILDVNPDIHDSNNIEPGTRVWLP